MSAGLSVFRLRLGDKGCALFDRIGDDIRPQKPSIFGASHWLTDVWVDQADQVWVKILSRRELRYSRLTDQQFNDHFRFVFSLRRPKTSSEMGEEP